MRISSLRPASQNLALFSYKLAFDSGFAPNPF